jgi:hypothetical protein
MSWLRQKKKAVCGARSKAGWVCNKDHYDAYHEFHDPGTGHGDDKTVRWVTLKDGREKYV